VTLGRTTLVFVILAVLASGCGSSDQTAAVPPTKARFVKEVDAVCVRAREHFQLLYEGYVHRTQLNLAKKRSVARWREITEEAFAPAVQREIAEIRALGAPKGDRGQVQEILAARRRGLEEVEANPIVMVNTEDQFRRFRKLTERYGLSACGF
jgi:hypothetical protein